MENVGLGKDVVGWGVENGDDDSLDDEVDVILLRAQMNFCLRTN